MLKGRLTGGPPTEDPVLFAYRFCEWYHYLYFIWLLIRKGRRRADYSVWVQEAVMDSEELNFGSADEQIRANGEAEAREADRLREENEAYRTGIEELKQLYRKNCDLIAQMTRALDKNASDVQTGMKTIMNGGVERIAEQTRAAAKAAAAAGAEDADSADEEDTGKEEILAAAADAKQEILNRMDVSDDSTHKDCVRVYRNVQAEIVADLDKQTKDIESAIYALQETSSNIESTLRQMQEEQIGQADKKKNHASVLAILSFILILLTGAFVVCDKFGLIDDLMHLLGV